MRSFFIAGTDTGVGKTIISCAMAAAFRLSGYKVGVMKPLACGSWEDSELLKRAAGCDDALSEITPVFLKQPLSPNVAAKLEKKPVRLSSIQRSYEKLRKKYDVLIVEGCGGLLVPVTDKILMIDLMVQMSADCILVSRSGLGAINHSLLSLEALRLRKIKTLGVIFNRLQGGEVSMPERTNPEVVAKIGRTRSLGMFPHMKTDCAVSCAGKAFLKHIDFKKLLC